MDTVDATALLDLARGELLVRAWPPDLRPPFGLRLDAGDLRGPARLRASVVRTLEAGRRPFRDRIAAAGLQPGDIPRPPEPPPAFSHAWSAHGGQGILCGLADSTRVDALMTALQRGRPALVVVRDSGAQSAWQRALAGHGIVADRRPTPAATVATAVEAARTMHWRSRRHDLLVVDRPEQMPPDALIAALDGSAALLRLGFVDRPGPELLRWSVGLGPVLGIAEPAVTPRRIELRVPLPPAEREVYEEAWHAFLAAFDAFASLRPSAGFGTFVQQARGDPRQRPGLSAWHRAIQAAAWNGAKAAACADLLARHRHERVLVFTPDRQSAYDLARSHLIAPVTAELPRHERQAALAAFQAGRLRALAGPRLLDLGVPERTADVGILVGGGFGLGQHEARCRRVAPAGAVYELVALDTLEVGRAHRYGRTIAPTAVVLHGDR